MPSYICDSITNAGHELVISEQLEGLVEADICYQTRIQEERFTSQDEANKYRGKFRLNQQIYTQHFKSQTVIMHPLPRDSRAEANELDNDLNLHPNLAIFRQTDNGVLVRMALFALTLGVADKVADFDRPVHWFSNKSST
jgi:aspartate carbamoyltransferase catalytic subunit